MFAERPAEGAAHTAQKRTQPLLCVPICRLRLRRCRHGGTQTRKRHIKSPWGEVPERSEGGGEAREGESGRATAGSDKRPRPSNTHEEANRHPLGWWAGLQGRWWLRPPSLLHWDIRFLGGNNWRGIC